MVSASTPLPAPLSTAQGQRCDPLDEVLLEFILLDDELGDEFIYIGEEPTDLGAQVLDVIMAELTRHGALAARLQTERVRAAMIHEFTRVEEKAPVTLAGLALYLTEISATPYAARRCVIDVAAALRRSGFTAHLSLSAGQHPQRPAAGWRQSLQRRHNAEVCGTVADEHRPHAGVGHLLLASVLLSSLALTTGSPSRGAMGEFPPSPRVDLVDHDAASISEHTVPEYSGTEYSVDTLYAPLRSLLESQATAPAGVHGAVQGNPPSPVSPKADPQTHTLTESVKRALNEH